MCAKNIKESEEITYLCNCGLKFTVHNWNILSYAPKCPKCLMEMSNKRIIKEELMGISLPKKDIEEALNKMNRG